jgi:hypothetical protein
MESPINIVVAKITGTQVYRGFGSGSIEKRYSDHKEKPFEMVLDDEENNPSNVQFLPNGNLCIYSCVGDEQPSSILHVVRDWKIEHVTHNVPTIHKEEFGRFFYRGGRGEIGASIPKELLHIFEQK